MQPPNSPPVPNPPPATPDRDLPLRPGPASPAVPPLRPEPPPTPPALPPALLVLAGHTHGGQIRGPGCTPVVPRGSGRFRSGWYDAALGRVYITRGIGTSVVPLRFLCTPELPIFTLRRA